MTVHVLRSLQRSPPPILAVGLVILAFATVSITYAAIFGLLPVAPGRDVITGLKIATLTIMLVLAGLIAWRIVRLWQARRGGRAGARMHVRLVGLFSITAVMPAIIVAVFASVTLNWVFAEWFSERNRTIMDSAVSVAQAYLNEHAQLLRADALAMGNDLNRASSLARSNPDEFVRLMTTQAAVRFLQGAWIVDANARILAAAPSRIGANPQPPPQAAYTQANDNGIALIRSRSSDLVRALVVLPETPGTYLYVARFIDGKVTDYMDRSRAAIAEYDALAESRGDVRFTFALVYLSVGLVVLLSAIWFGLWLADRLVAPVAGLAAAAQRISDGDLSASVETGPDDDEISMLGRTFNRMTGQLRRQHGELMQAQQSAEQRRKFTEAVLEGVSAGVVGLDEAGRINHVNPSAARMIGISTADLAGQPLDAASPGIAGLARDAMRNPGHSAEGQIDPTSGNRNPRTLLVHVTGDTGGGGGIGNCVITFDDITDLMAAQRSAAWSDIARRIAHEIKNPLTPIQLSAERLRRKYRGEISTDPGVFDECTQTIIRQVGDIGRMIDEFSSFARMPAPVMKETDLAEVVRGAVIPQRVAQPGIDYAMDIPDDIPPVHCDPHQLGQVLTNLLKNAAEALAAKEESLNDSLNDSDGEFQGRIRLTLKREGDSVRLTVSDNGIGLPKNDRHRLTEPYMTTRSRGTGLGLAIVRKIMEDHGGTLTLEDGTAPWATSVMLTLPIDSAPVEES